MVVLFRIVDPAGTATGEHEEGASRSNPIHEFRGAVDGSKIGVKYVAKTNAAEGCVNFTGRNLALLKPEFPADSHPDGGDNLDGSRAATDAGTVVQVYTTDRPDNGLVATSGVFQCPHVLH